MEPVPTARLGSQPGHIGSERDEFAANSRIERKSNAEDLCSGSGPV